MIEVKECDLLIYQEQIKQIIDQDFRHNILSLYDFFITAKHQNMCYAAKIYNISPSTISRSIKNLERKYATKLITAHNRGIKLTEFGEYLFKNLQYYFI